jgi:hypothetical protein
MFGVVEVKGQDAAVAYFKEPTFPDISCRD